RDAIDGCGARGGDEEAENNSERKQQSVQHSGIMPQLSSASAKASARRAAKNAARQTGIRRTGVTSMRRTKMLGRGLLVTVALAGTVTLPNSTVFGAVDAKGFVRIKPEEVKWVDEPDGLGVQRAVIQGDPAKEGIYVIRVRFPPHVMSNNHRHREDRHAVVLK